MTNCDDCERLDWIIQIIFLADFMVKLGSRNFIYYGKIVMIYFYF